VRGLCLPLRACSCCCARIPRISPCPRVVARACPPYLPVFPCFTPNTKHRPRVVYACRCVLARVVARAYLPYLPVSPSLLLCTNLRPSRSFTPNTAPASSLTRALLFSNSVFVLLL